jgi:hypothetical protein
MMFHISLHSNSICKRTIIDAECRTTGRRTYECRTTERRTTERRTTEHWMTEWRNAEYKSIERRNDPMSNMTQH